MAWTCLIYLWGLQAQLNAKLARRQRELEEEEAERKRKDAAAAKLRALDEAIAAREAERYSSPPVICKTRDVSFYA